MNNVIGTCSICGGRVIAPGMHIDPMSAIHCEKCGAKPKIPFRPLIDMEPAEEWGKEPKSIKWVHKPTSPSKFCC